MKPLSADDLSPQDYDQYALGWLSDRYNTVIQQVRAAFYEMAFFYNPVLESCAKHNVDWAKVARHLFLGFAACEAYGRSPAMYVNLWVRYVRVRVLPIAHLNRAMQSLALSVHDRSCVEFTTAALYAIAAQLLGQELSLTTSANRDFWVVHASVLRRIVETVWDETQHRFLIEYLHQPDILLATYDSHNSPLLRSGMLEAVFMGISACLGIRQGVPQWVRDYEQLRQLLDDIADVKEDLQVGRLTFPVLVGLHADVSASLRTLIEHYWASTIMNGSGNMESVVWAQIKSILKSCGAFAVACARVRDWIVRVQKGIANHGFVGNTEPLLLIVELKRAFMARLIETDFDDREPKFPGA
jgi:hypothetical protein